jgi:hypothetical protein
MINVHRGLYPNPQSSLLLRRPTQYHDGGQPLILCCSFFVGSHSITTECLLPSPIFFVLLRRLTQYHDGGQSSAVNSPLSAHTVSRQRAFSHLPIFFCSPPSAHTVSRRRATSQFFAPPDMLEYGGLITFQSYRLRQCSIVSLQLPGSD